MSSQNVSSHIEGKKEEEGRSLAEKMIAISKELAMEYPIPTYDGRERRPATAWMVVDLVAYSNVTPFGPIIRTFQARELINDNVSVTLPALRTQSFFTEVRKLLVFTVSMVFGEPVWNDEILNKHAVEVQHAKVVALMDDATIRDGKQVLEETIVVELFERATASGLERITLHVEWYDSSLSREHSLERVQLR